MSNRVVSLTFRHIIDDVIANVRQDFEDMGIEKEVLEELQRSWEAKLVATQVTEFDGAAGANRASHMYTVTPTAPLLRPLITPREGAADAPSSDANANANVPIKSEPEESLSQKRKRPLDDEGQRPDGSSATEPDKDEIGSDLDDSDDDDAEGTDDMILCLYDKVQRVKNKWKCVLRDGIASIGGRDYLFSKCNGCVARADPVNLSGRWRPRITCVPDGPTRSLLRTMTEARRASVWTTSALSLLQTRTIVLLAVLVHYVRRWARPVRAEGLGAVLGRLRLAILRRIFAWMMLIPSTRRRVEREMDAAVKDVARALIPTTAVPDMRALPAQGRDDVWVKAQLDALQRLGGHGEIDGRDVYLDGHVSGTVYHGGAGLNRLLSETLERFLLTNPLHPEVFPGLRKMEAEVVAMVLRMYHAPAQAAGTTTSGGTESIMMACLAMREWGRAERGIKRPEMVVPASAHVAFDKAGHYFGMTVRRVPVDPTTRKVNLSLMQRAINRHTVLLVGSAPNFPDGIIDDIVSIGALARRYQIGCHVDCCLGSFLVPFLAEAGFVTEPFDFRVDGVTSISCDTHKYGFAPKGSSIIMYHNESLRRYQYFVSSNWVGGVYASPTLAGSRPGALIAGAWAAMMHIGHDGYVQSCREIVGAAQTIERRVREEIPELQILGKPLVSVVAFASAGAVNIYDVGDQMSRRGWHLNAIGGDMPAFHIACTRLTVPVVDDFVRDLKDSVAQSRTRPTKSGTMATVYGLHSTTAVAPMLLDEMAARYIDTMYQVGPAP